MCETVVVIVAEYFNLHRQIITEFHLVAENIYYWIL